MGRGDHLLVSHPPSTSLPFSIRSLLPPPIADLPANLLFFINCYDKAICASVVTFDGLGNPCRQQILRMTFSNKALMEAIYALFSSSHLQSEKRGTLVIMDRRSSPSRLPQSPIPLSANRACAVTRPHHSHHPMVRTVLQAHRQMYSRNLRTHRSYRRRRVIPQNHPSPWNTRTPQ